MFFLKKKGVISFCVISVVIAIYLFLPFHSLTKLPNKKQVATTSTRSVVKDDEYLRNMSWPTEEIDKQELNRLYELGNTATPRDLRDIEFYEQGGLVSSTPEMMELSKEGVEFIKNRFRLMDNQGYYEVDFVDDLTINMGGSFKVKKILKALGASNYHEGIQNVNEHLSFIATDLDNSLFVNIPHLVSQTYGSLSFDRWSSVKHFFEDPELGIVRLSEQRSGPAGETMYILPVELNEEINGNPARYTVEVSPNGKAKTTLRWVNGIIMYTLIMQKNAGINNEAKSYFFELARSLPIGGGKE